MAEEARQDDVTGLLRAWSAGDRSAFDQLFPLVYRDLRARAATAMRQERSNHTLEPTALVHEAYLKLAGQAKGLTWQNRAHFFGVAARAMREVLVDHARRHAAKKRAGGAAKLSLEDVTVAAAPRSLDLLALDIALERLAAFEERQARLVELRLFAGLTIDESAEVLGISPATVSREWRHAEAWIQRELHRAPTEP